MDIDDYGILTSSDDSRADVHYAIETNDAQMLLEWIAENTTDDNVIAATAAFFYFAEENR